MIEDNKWCINFKNNNSIWTEAEYNNFINVMRSSGFSEEIEKNCRFINFALNIIKNKKIKKVMNLIQSTLRPICDL